MNILNESNNCPIGFFDSGVGGLTVLARLKKLLPNEHYIFYGDNANVPYGDKSREQLLSYSNNILEYFKKRNCKAVVMACNTTSSTVYEDLKNKFQFKLYPVVQSVAKVIAKSDTKRLGVFATKATIMSGAYEKEIKKFNPDMEIFSQYCPNWVKIVEDNIKNTPESIKIIKSDLDKMMINKPEKIVLGCTHYPYLIDVLSKFVPESIFIDPAIPFSEYIYYDLKCANLLNNENKSPCEEFYVSATPEKFKEAAQMFYPITKEPKLLTF